MEEEEEEEEEVAIRGEGLLVGGVLFSYPIPNHVAKLPLDRRTDSERSVNKMRRPDDKS